MLVRACRSYPIARICNPCPQSAEKGIYPGALAGGRGLISAMDYLGSFQYQDNVLKHFPTTEGYVSHVSGSYQYVFNYTDHLTTPPGFMGGTGNSGRIVTGGTPFELSGASPRFVRWNW